MISYLASAICIGVAVAFFSPFSSNLALIVVSFRKIPNRCRTSPEPDNAARNRSRLSSSSWLPSLAKSTTRAVSCSTIVSSCVPLKPVASRNDPSSVANVVICNFERPMPFVMVSTNSCTFLAFLPNTVPSRSTVSSMSPAVFSASPRKLNPLAAPRKPAMPAAAPSADLPSRTILAFAILTTPSNFFVDCPAFLNALVRPRALPEIITDILLMTFAIARQTPACVATHPQAKWSQCPSREIPARATLRSVPSAERLK